MTDQGTPPSDQQLALAIQSIMGQLVEPKLKWTLDALNLIQEVTVEDGKATVKLNLITDEPEVLEVFKQETEGLLRKLGAVKASVNIGRVNIATHGISGIGRVILVGSGKGGAGKSSVAVNLAGALARLGYATGLMDADIYGPSVPTMLGTVGAKPEVLPQDYLRPIEAHGLKTMSVGYLVPDGKALDWRGVMASGTLLQFIQSTLWGKLDYLVIDLPPGTGDIQLTLAHKVRAAGAVMVTTPQEVVLGDVRRALDLMTQREIPVLGLVENMSFFVCSHCGGQNHPFPEAPQAAALQQSYPLLSRIPLDARVAKGGDSGLPVVFDDTAVPLTELFLELGRQVAALVPVERPVSSQVQ